MPIVKSHPRTTFIEGDACRSFVEVRNLIPVEAGVLLIEDSAHTFANTMNVLNTFSTLVQPDGYFIVEDGYQPSRFGGGAKPRPLRSD